jgi:very-short-patch-repair endonuclease
LSRFGNSEYKNIIEKLCACRQDSEKPSYDEAVEMLDLLARYQKKCALYYEAEASIKPFLGSAYTGIETDWNYLTAQMKKLQSIFADNIFFGRLTLYADFVSESNNFADYARRFEAAFIGCNDTVISQIAAYFDKSVLDIIKADCSVILARFNNCLNELDKLDIWNHFRALLSDLNDKQVISYIDIVIDRNLEPKYIVGAFRKLFYSQWIDCILAESPVLSDFNRIAHDKAIKVFAEKDTEQFEINKAKIRAELSARRPNTDLVAPGSPLSVLLREGEKKRKQKSIRKLLSEVGEIVQVVKPCFLMSPLSVSTFLPIDSVHFDVVIFDEASQIFPQDAIGAIYRAKQLIVVGDSKQMPPSNFFNSSFEVEDNDEETGDITDFESILDLCSTSMQQIRLCWHYRSRCEQLIAFSNKNFYDNELITFPSSQADAVGMGVDYYHVDGVFDRKSHTNRKEAEFIVELIYQNIEKYPNRSLGVIAFSEAQQTFFVKNLETVQGDERDTIIFSVAYGVDTQGRLLYNFGPLNRIGGERRLNVAVTRAKYNIQLVSSMHYTDIDLTRTSAVGAKLLREYLDFAENGNIALERALSVNTFDRFDSDFELEVCDFLRSKGFAVDTQVGCSGFRIDLGLKKPDSSDYVLAIECDGATYHSSKNARDRDRLRQEILERMGWRFYRIWSTDWFRNKSDEQFRLLAAAQEAINNPIIAAEKPVSSQQQEFFEEVAEENHFEFPPYQAADIPKIRRKHSSGNFKGIIKAILEVEAPLSEELLLKRMLWYFNHEKVTNVVRRDYEQQMCDCQSYGIIRKNGFLYLDNGKEIKFRTPGDIERDIKHIAPEELAAGMLEIIKQNITVDKEGLYRLMASQCGANRVGNAANEALDSALYLLGDYIEECDNKIKLKEVKNCINEDVCVKRESEQLSQPAKADVTISPSSSDNGFLGKPTESKLANNNLNKHNVANKTKKEATELIRTLADSQFVYIDNRAISGILWVLYVADKSKVFEEILADYDVHYTLEKRGSLATKNAPAWRVMFN